MRVCAYTTSRTRSNRWRAAGSSRPIRPPIPGPLPNDVVAQTEDVLVDTRGYIYITDKNWGMSILRYSGPNQATPTDR